MHTLGANVYICTKYELLCLALWLGGLYTYIDDDNNNYTRHISEKACVRLFG